LDAWNELPTHFLPVQLGDIVIMPNHIHAIIALNNCDKAGQSPAATISSPSLSVIVGEWISYSTNLVNAMNQTPGKTLWQRGFHDHIIRSKDEWQQISLYITSNPSRWLEDDEYMPE